MKTPANLPRMWACSFALLLLLFTLPARAADTTEPAAPPVCIVCDRPITAGVAWKHPRGLVCDECHKLELHCSLCGLPIKGDFARTQDGRAICKFDAPDAVLNPVEARRIYDETAATLGGWASGAFTLRSTNISVTLFDVDYWNYQNGKAVADELKRYGFSQTRNREGTLIHTVVLLSGRLKNEIADVCAHEYTHLWVNENRPDGRVIEPDTLEAICELSAYQLASSRNDTNALEKIRQNPYTNGRILTLINAAEKAGFGAVLQWVKTGTSATLDPESLTPLEAEAPATTAAPKGGFIPPPPPTPGPEKLLLLGLSGSKKHRFALINDQTFAAGEEARVKIGLKPVMVKCLEIHDDSVVVSQEGGQPVTLYLGNQ